MPLVRRLARPMLASMFVIGGLDAFRHPDSKTAAAENVVSPLVDRIPGVSNSTELVKYDGAAKMIGGVALALGKFPRLAALGLAASLAPTTLAGHRFWEDTDPAKKAQNKIHFFKNVSLLGALLLAAVDTEGKPSLGYRARRAPTAARRAAHDARLSATVAAHDAVGTVRDVLPVG